MGTRLRSDRDNRGSRFVEYEVSTFLQVFVVLNSYILPVCHLAFQEEPRIHHPRSRQPFILEDRTRIALEEVAESREREGKLHFTEYALSKAFV
jgi:hypothetical protein